MELRRVRESLCGELVQQSTKLGFATIAIVTLLVINSNLTRLVHCLGGVANEAPLARSRLGHGPKPLRFCPKLRFGQVTSLELRCCNGTVSVKGDGQPLIEYRNGSRFIDWIRACRRRTCAYISVAGSVDCPRRSRFGSNVLCLNATSHIAYGTFGGYRLSPGDTFQTVINIADTCST